MDVFLALKQENISDTPADLECTSDEILGIASSEEIAQKFIDEDILLTKEVNKAENEEYLNDEDDDEDTTMHSIKIFSLDNISNTWMRTVVKNSYQQLHNHLG